MKNFHHLFKISAATILQGSHSLLHYILLRLCCIFLGVTSINTTVLANDAATLVDKSRTEATFLQGQQYIEQANLPLAELSLTHIYPASPYAKILAGNIAAQKGEYDRAFLLLLPLQSNHLLTNIALASLHTSLSIAYEKQGDTIRALDQLILKEIYLEDIASINKNHEHIWQLLYSLSVQDLITMRGESANTTTQGWIDLSLAAKDPSTASNINTWATSYPDHVAGDVAKKLLTQTKLQSDINDAKSLETLPSNGNIALILTLENKPLSAKAVAFTQGLQAAINKHAMPNEVKVYFSQDSNESISQQYELAKSNGAEYFLAPKLNELLEASNTNLVANANTNDVLITNNAVIRTDLSISDEAQAIADFANNNAFQYVTIISTEDKAANQMLKSFLSAWKDLSSNDATVITLTQNIKSGDTNLLDLRAKIASHTHDIVVLAMSAQSARIVKPYIDISTPVLAFSSIHETPNDDESNAPLHAVRFVEIPFLINLENAKFDYYRNQATHIEKSGVNSNQFLRTFALGVDCLQLLIHQKKAINHEIMINGLTGMLSIDKVGTIKRQLSIARFTYDGVVQDQ